MAVLVQGDIMHNGALREHFQGSEKWSASMEYEYKSFENTVSPFCFTDKKPEYLAPPL